MKLQELSLADLIALKNELELTPNKYTDITGVDAHRLIKLIKTEIYFRISQIKFD